MAERAVTVELAAGVAEDITLGNHCRSFELVHHGNVSNPVYCRVGATAVVEADENEILLAGERLVIGVNTQSAAPAISLISAGAAKVTAVGRY